VQPSASPIQLGSYLLLASTDLLCLPTTAFAKVTVNASGVAHFLPYSCIYFSFVCVKTHVFHLLLRLNKCYRSFNILGTGSLGKYCFEKLVIMEPV